MSRPSYVIRESEITWDDTYDIVVVGGGMGGFSSALNAHRLDSRVVLLEKSPEVGGTTKKSAAWYWIPNNSYMRDAGLKDDKRQAIRYMARLSRPQTYAPTHERFGASEWEYSMMEAFFDNASTASDILADMGAIRPMYSPHIPDYHATLHEATVPYGRTLMVEGPDNGEPGRGDVLVAQLVAAAEARAIPVLVNHAVRSVVINDDGAVVGVCASANGKDVLMRAAQGVIFASGGFTHDRELRLNFLPAPVYSGCAARANEGDFVRIAVALGAPLWNMQFAWLAPLPFEIVLEDSPYLSGMFAVVGDSMIWVNKYGERVVNEKAVYNELAMTFFEYDTRKLEYPNRLLFMIWDQRTMDQWQPVERNPTTTPSRLALDNEGNIVYDDFHLIPGDDLRDLESNIVARLEKLVARTGGFTLDPLFSKNLPRTISRFNGFAEHGKDLDFGRGENPIEVIFNGEARQDNRTDNPTMYPLSESGPYYAAIVCAGTLDTKGGPRTTPNGEVVGGNGQPIAGLYGVGNCVASMSAQGYWAGGATLGPIMTFGYLAAEHAAKQPRR